MKQRLDRIVNSRSSLSRSEAQKAIRRGRVTVDGAVIRRPEEKVEAESRIEVDGAPLLGEHIYLMLNKPQGVVSATRDAKLPTVVDLVPPQLQRSGLFPAGRLDRDTEGFVLITDDGDFAHRILSPRRHVPKTYHARVDIPITEAMVQAFAEGVEISGGDRCLPAELRLLEAGEQPLAEVILHEGMYHQIKRMFEAFGGHVVALRRVKMGALALDEMLAPGECRPLNEAEIAQILGELQ